MIWIRVSDKDLFRLCWIKGINKFVISVDLLICLMYYGVDRFCIIDRDLDYFK